MKTCPKCGVEKPLTEFYQRKNPRWESERYHSYCKKCTISRRSEWYYNQGGKERTLARQKKHREENPELYSERNRKNHWEDKMRSINAYGGKCECCGETEPKFLAIDHVEGGGNLHRKTIKNQTIYAWLRQRNYPSGFRVLCHNCNMAIAFWKVCPHKL